MREKAGKRVLILAVLFCLGLCMAISQPKGGTMVQAKEQSVEQTEKWTEMRSLASRGNLLYQDSGERVGIFAADFFLLEEKLSSVPETVFDPAAYGNGSTPEKTLEMPEPEETEEEQDESVSENDCEEGENL